jgi:hypothetical protein
MFSYLTSVESKQAQNTTLALFLLLGAAPLREGKTIIRNALLSPPEASKEESKG